MDSKMEAKDSVFDSITWDAQKYDAEERRFQEVCDLSYSILASDWILNGSQCYS